MLDMSQTHGLEYKEEEQRKNRQKTNRLMLESGQAVLSK